MTTANITSERPVASADRSAARVRPGGSASGSGGDGADTEGADFLQALSKLVAPEGEPQAKAPPPRMPGQALARLENATDPGARLAEVLGRMPPVVDGVKAQTDTAPDRQGGLDADAESEPTVAASNGPFPQFGAVIAAIVAAPAASVPNAAGDAADPATSAPKPQRPAGGGSADAPLATVSSALSAMSSADHGSEAMAARADAQSVTMLRPLVSARSSAARDNGGGGMAVAQASVVRRETHLAPAPPPPAAEQVADRVAAELADTGAGSAEQAAPSSQTDPDGDARPLEPPARGAVASTLDRRAEAGLPGPASLRQSSPVEPGRMGKAADKPVADLALPQQPSASLMGSDWRLQPYADTAAVAPDAAAAPRLDPASAAAPASPSAVVKVITIQLQPADLGTVTVRMALKDGELDLQLQVERHETARLLQNDRDKLSEVLRAAGYHIDDVGVVVKAAAADTTGGAMQSAHAPANSSGQSPGSPHSGAGSSSGGRAQSEQHRNSHSQSHNRHEESSHTRASTDSGLYL